MEDLLQASFEFQLTSIPFIVSGIWLGIVAMWVLFMRGASSIRAWFVGHNLCLILSMLGHSAAASAVEPSATELLYRMGVCLFPLSSVCAMSFLFAVTRQLTRYRKLVIASAMIMTVAIPVTLLTTAGIEGHWTTRFGLSYYRLSPLAWLQLIPLLFFLGLGIQVARREYQNESSQVRRRQIRGAAIAVVLSALSVIDIPLGYGFDTGMPASWFFFCLGSAWALRSIIADDLIRASEFDRRSLFALGYALVSGLFAYLLSEAATAQLPPVLIALIALSFFLFLRIAIALASKWNQQRAAKEESPLDRALKGYAEKVHHSRDMEEISSNTQDILQLGLGVEWARIITVASGSDQWIEVGVGSLSDDEIPSLELVSWLSGAPSIIARDALDDTGLQECSAEIEKLCSSFDAELILPLANRDEIIGLVFLPPLPSGRHLRSQEESFLGRVKELSEAAFIYAKMHGEATRRVAVAKEVELAAALQAAFIPTEKLYRLKGLAVSGIYIPASKCGGDWWSVHKLDDYRTLVMIGDVTGHGVAAAMVTAAAKGCYDVAERLWKKNIDLEALLKLLDTSVRVAGAEQFYMTCFATIIDTETQTLYYANAGHVPPYVCRRNAKGKVGLDVLVARGNPLGAGNSPTIRTGEQKFEPGDLMIWLTDGIVELTNADGKQLSDRKFQRFLRKLDLDEPANTLRDEIVRMARDFQAGVPADDDITLVVGQVA